MPKPTVYRLVQSLVKLGYLTQDPVSGAYLRAPAFERLSRDAPHDYLRLRYLPIMEKLSRQFEETVAMGLLCGRMLQILSVLESPHALRRVVRAGENEPYYAGALGLAIASRLPAIEQKQLLMGAELKSSAPRAVGSKRELQKVLDATRERGWAIDEEESDQGVVSFAIPLMDRDRPVAALGIAVPVIRLSDPRRVEILAALEKIPEVRPRD